MSFFIISLSRLRGVSVIFQNTPECAAADAKPSGSPFLIHIFLCHDQRPSGYLGWLVHIKKDLGRHNINLLTSTRNIGYIGVC